MITFPVSISVCCIEWNCCSEHRWHNQNNQGIFVYQYSWQNMIRISNRMPYFSWDVFAHPYPSTAATEVDYMSWFEVVVVIIFQYPSCHGDLANCIDIQIHVLNSCRIRRKKFSNYLNENTRLLFQIRQSTLIMSWFTYNRKVCQPPVCPICYAFGINIGLIQYAIGGDDCNNAMQRHSFE